MNRSTAQRTSMACVGLCAAGLFAAWSVLRDANLRLNLETVSSGNIPREKLTADGLENLWKLPLSDGRFLYSGGQPDGETGFRALQQLGIRTVISVDGARPDLETAGKYGLRYVHLPISYDEVPEQRQEQLARAARTLPGPIYVHCHHGKHRGPASAVCLWRSLHAGITPDQGLAAIRDMGTALKYRGLYRSVEQAVPRVALPGDETADFPEVTPVPALAEQMVAIDLTWERLQALAKTPAPSEAQHRAWDESWTDLGERFRESARLTEADSPLRAALAETADFIGETLSSRDSPEGDDGRRAALAGIESRCAACHAAYRD